MVTVDGTGSTWIHNDNGWNPIYIGGDDFGEKGKGTLNITGGGTMDATGADIHIYSQSLLAIDVGNGSILRASILNDGKVRFLAGAGPAPGAQFTPILGDIDSDSTGICQAVGGTWDATSKQFTVSSVQPGAAGAHVSINPATIQRMFITDSATGQSVGMSFLAAGVSDTEIDVLATTMDDDSLGVLQGLLPPDQSVLGAWNFSVTGDGYAVDDPAYLSFDIGAGYSRNNLQVWHYDGSLWTKYAASDLTCNGTYASFTVTGFSGYAVATVPEPSTLALLSAAGLGLLWRLRRRRK